MAAENTTDPAEKKVDADVVVEGEIAPDKFDELYAEIEQLSQDGLTDEERLAINTKLHEDGLLPELHIVGIDEKQKAVMIQNTQDKSTVWVDEKGQVIMVEDANKQKRSFTYDDKGELKTITDGGKEYHKNNQGVWVDRDNKPTGASNPEVDKDGNYSFTNADGNKTARRADGSQVQTDKNGNVTEITYANGSKRSLQYDKDGNITGITEEEKGGKNKKQYHQGEYVDKNGVKKTGWVDEKGNPTGNSNPKVNADGSYSYLNEKGNVVTHDTNGTSTTSKHALKIDANGKVTEVKYPSGYTQSFTYDKDGNLSQVKDQTGGQWTLGPDGKWRGPNGAVSDASVRVDEDGTVHIVNKDGSSEAHKADGSSFTRKADGSEHVRNQDGQLTEIRNPAGLTTKITYSDTGPKASITRIESGNLVFVQGADGKLHLNGEGPGLNATVNQHSEIVLAAPDGSGMTVKADGSLLMTDAQKNVTGILYPDGSTRGFQYANGQLVGIKDGNDIWTRNTDGTWSGPKMGTAQSINVDAHGNYIIKQADGTTTYRYTDLTSATVYANGTTVTRNAYGNVTGVKAGGTTWQRGGENGEQWIEVRNGKPTGKASWQEPQVDKNGNVIFGAPQQRAA